MKDMNKDNYRPSIVLFFEEGTDPKLIAQKKDEILKYDKNVIGAILKRSKYPMSYMDPEEAKRRKYAYIYDYYKRRRAERKKHKYAGHIPKIVKEALGCLDENVRLFIYKLKDTQAYFDGINNPNNKLKKIYIEPKFAKFLAGSKHTELVIETNFYAEYKMTEDFIQNYRSYFAWKKYSVTKAEQMSYMRKNGTIMPQRERENRERYGCLKPKQIEELKANDQIL